MQLTFVTKECKLQYRLVLKKSKHEVTNFLSQYSYNFFFLLYIMPIPAGIVAGEQREIGFSSLFLCSTIPGRMYLSTLELYTRLPLRTKLLLFKTYIRPVMTYAAPAWAFIPKSSKKYLQAVQNKFLRIIGGYDMIPLRNKCAVIMISLL